jgi:hypothetical protein
MYQQQDPDWQRCTNIEIDINMRPTIETLLLVHTRYEMLLTIRPQALLSLSPISFSHCWHGQRTITIAFPRAGTRSSDSPTPRARFPKIPIKLIKMILSPKGLAPVWHPFPLPYSPTPTAGVLRGSTRQSTLVPKAGVVISNRASLRQQLSPFMLCASSSAPAAFPGSPALRR